MSKGAVGFDSETTIMEMIVDKLACLAIIASAIEVFPRECIGLTFGKDDNIVFGIPIQLARRRDESVSTISELIGNDFERFFGMKRICGYHSHTFKSSEKEAGVEPSKTDIEGLDIGGIEVIINIRRRRKKLEYVKSENGEILMAFGGYEGRISAFERLEGKDKNGPLYRTVHLSLGK